MYRHSRIIVMNVLAMMSIPNEFISGPSAYMVGEKKFTDSFILWAHIYAIEVRTVRVRVTETKTLIVR